MSEIPICDVAEMRLSGDRCDYFVRIRVGDREITPHVFRERWKAEYEVAEWQWLLNGGEKPDLMDFGPRSHSEASDAEEVKARRSKALDELGELDGQLLASEPSEKGVSA